jgi:protease PrsW
LILALIIPIFALGAIRALDLYQTGQFRLILYSVSGGVFAYGLASTIHLTLEEFGLADRQRIIAYFAPFTEEFLKGLVLLFMFRRYRFTYLFDGALYGFATGIGFAVAENIGYIFVQAAGATEIAIGSVPAANLVHASCSAIVGIALGMVYLRRSPLRWLAFVAGLFLAISQHMVYNKVIQDSDSSLSAIGIGLLGAAFVVLSIQHGKKQAQNWIKQKLGIDDGVTRHEVVAVDRLASSDVILFPILERFGPEKATQVEKLLYLEARLGLKRNALDSVRDNSDLHRALEAEVRAMRKKIKATHRAIGAYTMLFVRGLFTSEMISVWDRMQAKVRERSASTGGQKGGGLWTSLEERLKAIPGAERQEERE